MRRVASVGVVALGFAPVARAGCRVTVAGFDWVHHHPSYFLRGFAVHGYPDVPPYPASRGCARRAFYVELLALCKRELARRP